MCTVCFDDFLDRQRYEKILIFFYVSACRVVAASTQAKASESPPDPPKDNVVEPASTDKPPE